MATEVRGSGNIEVCPWLKSMPVAPEYHPTLAEFQDPIAYIFKIEKEASKYGICKIVPPVAAAPRKTIIANFNKSLLARSNDPESGPTFTTRQQQIGFCPRKHRPVQKPVWQSGERYTLSEFEAKAKNFEKSYLKKYAKKVLNPLEMETLYWNAIVDKPFSVEYANDMPGSAFVMKKSSGKKSESAMTVGDTEWNMRGVSRANVSLLKFMKEEIPGVTSPMVYAAMMFSWFAWHVEDHDLHSLNYLHMGSSKTWYGVPREAAVAFEEVIREHGYAGEINPLVTFATLGEKTTVMSPEVLLSAGVPCCRLVQNAGDFVVTFPRAYHSGFSHGFNCGEAANIATPEWLRVARKAAIRRASINCAPMVSHFQLLYDLALYLCSRVPKKIVVEPRSSRLKEKKKSEGEMLIKELFHQDMIQNNEMLHVLGNGSSIVLLSQNSLSSSNSQAKSKMFPSLCSPDLELLTTKYNARDEFMIERTKGMKQANDYSVIGNVSSCSDNTDMKKAFQSEQGLFSCVTCGILCFSCVAILKPAEAAAQYLMSADCSKFDDWGVSINDRSYVSDANAPNMNPYSVLELIKSHDGLYNVPISSGRQVQNLVEKSVDMFSNSRASKGPSSLGLLALAYGDSSDSEDSEAKNDIPENGNACDNIDSELNCRNLVLQQFSDSDAKFVPPQANRDSQSIDEFRTNNCTVVEPNSLTHMFRPKSQLHCADEDSSRLHVFCLEHAIQVEKRLSSIGGAHVFLVCHPDYPKLESHAKRVAEELESGSLWNENSFSEATGEDEDMIRLALDSENAIHGNGDWTVKLGINLFYSANLSRSPLYCKQMPFNHVIYTAFGRGSPNSDLERKGSSGRQRKIVVTGKWCGKVWMSNQSHPLLLNKDLEEQELEFSVGSGIKRNLTYERRLEGSQAVGIASTTRKRKRTAVNGSFMKEKEIETQEMDETRRDFVLSYCRKKNNGKQMKKETSEVERLDECSEEAEASNSCKKIKGRRGTRRPNKEILTADENLEESSEEISLTNSWKQIKNKAMRTRRETPVPEEKIKKRFDPLTDDELAGGPSTRLRKRMKKTCRDSTPKVVKPKPVPKHQQKERIAKKGISLGSNNKVRNKDEEGEYQCDMEGCTMSLGSKHELTLHKRNICPLKGCGKKFFSHKYLLQHRRVHEDDRPLKCPWKGCKMTFKWAWARTEHIRIHTGDRPYVCTLAGCGQTFRFVSDFSRHKRKTGHTPKKSRG